LIFPNQYGILKKINDGIRNEPHIYFKSITELNTLFAALSLINICTDCFVSVNGIMQPVRITGQRQEFRNKRIFDLSFAFVSPVVD